MFPSDLVGLFTHRLHMYWACCGDELYGLEHSLINAHCACVKDDDMITQCGVIMAGIGTIVSISEVAESGKLWL